jgi:aryl-alcohol dehydrogenase-like predicted oxidoreductase
MGEEFHKSVTPGVIWDGFGQQRRLEILRVAYEGGINFFDVTMDSEKEALGRNLQEMPPPRPVYIQTRPEGMVYNNDPSDEDKSRLLDYGLLKAEAEHACELLRRDRIDFYNIGLFAPAIQRQPGYLGKLSRNVERLKADGLIRFACVDTLTGEALSLEMIETASFDAVFTNLSVVGDAALEHVIPAAQERGMSVFTRETFLKGGLFRLGEEAGITDRSGLARASVRWLLAQEVATSLVLGVASPELLAENLKAAEQPELTDEDKAVLDTLRASPEFAEARAGQRDFFMKGWG